MPAQETDTRFGTTTGAQNNPYILQMAQQALDQGDVPYATSLLRATDYKIENGRVIEKSWWERHHETLLSSLGVLGIGLGPALAGMASGSGGGAGAAGAAASGSTVPAIGTLPGVAASGAVPAALSSGGTAAAAGGGLSTALKLAAASPAIIGLLHKPSVGGPADVLNQSPDLQALVSLQRQQAENSAPLKAALVKLATRLLPGAGK